MADIIQIRRDLAAEWTTVNPTLASGEFGLETDTKLMKLGDGTTPWITLPYLFGSTLAYTDRIVLVADGYYDLPQFFVLDNFVVQPASDINLKIGSTAGGEEYFLESEVPSSTGAIYAINLFSNVIKRLYFSGITASTAIVLFRKYVKQS